MASYGFRNIKLPSGDIYNVSGPGMMSGASFSPYMNLASSLMNTAGFLGDVFKPESMPRDMSGASRANAHNHKVMNQASQGVSAALSLLFTVLMFI